MRTSTRPSPSLQAAAASRPGKVFPSNQVRHQTRATSDRRKKVKVWFQNRRTKWRHEAAKKEKRPKEQTSTETMNNCIQKEEVKNEKERKHACDESVLKKSREQSITDQISNKK